MSLRESVVTQSTLARQLSAIGVKAGQTIMLHVSVKAIGWIIGGPDVLLETLLERLGETGTLMMYVAWEERPEHFARWSPVRQKAFLEECPPFRADRSRANRKWSILTEYLRTWPGAFRSVNPGASMVAVGARARWITAGHSLQYGYGPDSPLAKLCEVDGSVLQIGVAPRTVTLIHHAEHLARIPNKKIFRYRVPIQEGANRIWINIEEYDTNGAVVEWSGGDYFEPIMEEFHRIGAVVSGSVGAAKSYLFSARRLRDFAVDWLESHFA